MTANRLKERRIRLGYTQADLAQMVGATERTVRNWESGRRVPQLSRRRPLARALELGLDEVADLMAELQANHDALGLHDQDSRRSSSDS
jgi:transcriptional regulator with XRE-family HTH domain